MKHIVCVDQGCHWQRWRVPSFWNGFFRWFCQDFWCHIVWALFGLWIDGRFAVDTCRREGDGGRGEGRAGKVGRGKQAAATNKNEKTKQERCVLVSRSVPYKKF